ncbi:MAG: single-stranded DNA-binding protein [bacterium]|nr:single-stranded DNA-binding protein [bacterium]
MMRGKASVSALGNVTRDMELRATANGTSVCSFGLAVNDRRDDPTVFLDCEAWGKTAETLAEHVHKGDPLYVEGRLRADQWEDRQTGQKRTRHIVSLNDFRFISSGERRETQTERREAPQAPAAPPATQQAPSQAPSTLVTPETQDIPF